MILPRHPRKQFCFPLVIILSLVASQPNLVVSAKLMATRHPWNAPVVASEKIFPPNLKIVSSTNSRLILEMIAPNPQLIEQGESGKPCIAIEAEGFTQTGDPGSPAILSTGYLVGIPEGSSPILTISGMEVTNIPVSHSLCPVPTPIKDPNGDLLPGQAETSLITNDIIYNHDAFFPLEPVGFTQAGMIRNQAVGQILFYPVQYNSILHQLRLIRKIRVEVVFDQGSSTHNIAISGPDDPFETIIKNTLINYDQARVWRTSPQIHSTAPNPMNLQAVRADTLFKINIDQDGLYQVSYTTLLAAGAPVGNIDPHRLKLFSQNVEIPLLVIGEEDGVFNSEDYFLFYGTKFNSRYTDMNAYWLSWEGNPGRRMETQSGVVSGTAEIPSSYTNTLHLEQNLSYRNTSASGPGNDHWYWTEIVAYNSPASQDFPFSISNLSGGENNANLRILFKGSYADAQHYTQVSINGNLLQSFYWPSLGELAPLIEFPQNYLHDGANTITVDSPLDTGITIDQTLINWFEIQYQHTFTAENNEISFSSDENGIREYQIAGFSRADLSVFDITDVCSPIRIIGANVVPDGSTFRLHFEQTISTPRRFLVLPPTSWHQPRSIKPDTPSELTSSGNGADYLIISYADFIDPIQSLAAFRQSQGLRVAIIDVEDIYDEFNGGVFSPEAIQEFISYTYNHWVPPAPSYVLLVGDGHYDYKNYYGTSGINYIPPYLGEYDPWVGETAADNRFVIITGNDVLPDMFIGRLPANTPGETGAMVTKILAYEQAPGAGSWINSLEFVADNADSGGNFPELSDVLVASPLITAYTKEKIYFGITHTIISSARTALQDAINQGRLIINYTGHGSTQAWASEQLLNVGHLANLNNSNKYPFFVPLTCAEGYFIFPAPKRNLPSLAESFLRSENKGSIASFSPTGYGLAAGHDVLAQGLYNALFADNQIQFGPATTAAKLHLFAVGSSYLDLIDTYTLFGDPATRLKTTPTAVTLTSFTGTAGPGGSQLDWQTANENWLIGFNLYRADTPEGPRTKLNPEIIPADYPAQMVGSTYEAFDPLPPGTTRYYWLESVLISGTEENGPVIVSTNNYFINLPLLTR